MRLIRKIFRALGKLVPRVFRPVHGPCFEGSEAYWEQRYYSGRNSGAGSYGKLAAFKAEILNDFVREHDVRSVIEHGCGDGNQLSLMLYPSYVGIDTSLIAIALCGARFAGDPSRRFVTPAKASGERAELAVSLDVIYHLVEDHAYQQYMQRLFASAERFVIIYSSNHEEDGGAGVAHVRHRRFSSWVDENAEGWRLVRHVPNRYPGRGDRKTSFADFYIYARAARVEAA